MFIIDNNFYLEEYKLIEDTINFIKLFRNTKQENNIGKDMKVLINNDMDYNLIINMLKIKDNLVNEKLDITSYKVNYGVFSLTIYYEKTITEEDILLKEKCINELKLSIEKREKLLSNTGFVSKAPKELVNEENIKLEKERKELELLM